MTGVLAEIDYGLIITSVTTLLMTIITGYFALKMEAVRRVQLKQGEEITETKHIVNSRTDKQDAEIKRLQEALKVMTGDKATLVEQARDKTGDLPKKVVVEIPKLEGQ